MSKWIMRGHIGHLRFKTSLMTLETPQCEIFWPLQSSSEFSGVPRDFKFPLLGVWISSSHLAQSEVTTPLVEWNYFLGKHYYCNTSFIWNSWLSTIAKLLGTTRWCKSNFCLSETFYYNLVWNLRILCSCFNYSLLEFWNKLRSSQPSYPWIKT
jgi:hypothetical protein